MNQQLTHLFYGIHIDVFTCFKATILIIVKFLLNLKPLILLYSNSFKQYIASIPYKSTFSAFSFCILLNASLILQLVTFISEKLPFYCNCNYNITDFLNYTVDTYLQYTKSASK